MSHDVKAFKYLPTVFLVLLQVISPQSWRNSEEKRCLVVLGVLNKLTGYVSSWMHNDSPSRIQFNIKGPILEYIKQ